ncbi:hypothetical protein Y032_0031g2307 [Ancylostoma ceylanicum]|uniref:Uncharacterized protein n=1 Tax=Ancylostoma ceylanicum TaxID=53326 RepID=A0A016UPS7_9BILA|nr:hypothetical protein Y032_0031g2307 [Ancylostoma ceylanicum]
MSGELRTFLGTFMNLTTEKGQFSSTLPGKEPHPPAVTQQMRQTMVPQVMNMKRVSFLHQAHQVSRLVTARFLIVSLENYVKLS